MTTEETTIELDGSVDGLAARIELPLRPEAVLWRHLRLGNPDNRVPGPTDRRLDALLTYTPEDAAELVELLGAHGGQTRSVPLESWHPDELRSLADERQRLVVTEYGAAPFVSSPYTQGTVWRVEGTDRFVLTLLSF